MTSAAVPSHFCSSHSTQFLGAINSHAMTFFRSDAGASVESVPEWIQLLPSGTFTGADGRGPFVLEDVDAMIAASMIHGRKLPIDENHSTDVAAAGDPTPARGWITQLEARADGVWGQVEWTDEGRRLVAAREYGFISPVFMSTEEPPHRIVQLLRASLVNDPNLLMKSLHQKETVMENELIALLGLEAGTSRTDIMAAATARLAAGTAAIDGLAAISAELEMEDGATADTMVQTIHSRLSTNESGPDDSQTVINGLQEQIKQLSTQLNATTTSVATDRATAIVEGAIEAGKLVPSLREHYISRHIKNPADVETEIAAMPSLHAGGLGNRDVETDAGTVSGADNQVCQMMGLDPKAFAATRKTEQLSSGGGLS